MTADQSIFVEYKNCDLTVGTAKSGVNLNVVGKSKVNCQINGININFDDLLHITELSSSLRSPEKFSGKALLVNLGINQVTISRENRVVL